MAGLFDENTILVPITDEEEKKPITPTVLPSAPAQEENLFGEGPLPLAAKEQNLINGILAGENTPEQTAADRDLAKALDLPDGVVSPENRSELEKQATQGRVTNIPDSAPVTKNLFSGTDSLVPALANSEREISNLVASEKAAKSMSFGDSVLQTLNMMEEFGYRFIEVGAELSGDEEFEASIQAKAEAAAAAAAEFGPRRSVFDIDTFEHTSEWWAQTTGQLIPFMLPSLVSGAAGAKAGAVIGLVGGPAGVAAGAVIGGFVGAFIPSLVFGVGEVQSGIKERDVNIEAPAYALGGGAIIALLDSVLPGKVGSMFVKSFGREVAEELITKIAVKQIALNAAKETGKGVSVEALTEGIQEVIAEVAAASATDQEIDVVQLARAFVEAAAAGAIGGKVQGLASLNDSRKVNKAFKDLNKLKAESKLEQLAADKSAEVRVAQMKAAGINQVFVPVAKLIEYAQATGNPVEILQALNIQNLEALAAAPGTTQVGVPLENFTAEILGKEGFSLLEQHLTVSENAQSLAAATEEAFTAEEVEADYLADLEAFDLSEDLKAKVEETVKKAAADPKNAATILQAAGSQVEKVMDVLIADVQARKVSTREAEVTGRLEQLDEDIAQEDRTLIEVEAELDAVIQENAGLAPSKQKGTKRLETKIDKILAARDALVEQQAELNMPDPTTGNIVPTEGSVQFEPLSEKPEKESPQNDQIIEIAQKYTEEAGLPDRRQTTSVKVDPERGKRIADAYEAMEHNPADPEVKAAYDAMIAETIAQWKMIESELGITIQFIKPGQPNPYPTPQAAIDDVNNNNHFWVFPTSEGFGQLGEDTTGHPMLAPTGIEIDGVDTVANDIFRIVHDIFGHVKEGHGFGPSGEENAWQAHVRMYSELAAKAMTTETRGQSSSVNYGPNGEQNRATPQDTIFAEQKAGLLPDWAMTEGLAPDQGGDFSAVTRPPIETNGTITVTHHSSQALEILDPAFQGSNENIQGGETNRRGDDGYVARVYVGIAEGRPGGYRPEAGIGDKVTESSVKADKLYDFAADIDGLKAAARETVLAAKREKNEALNKTRAAEGKTPVAFAAQENTGATKGLIATAYEAAIKKAGYKGYWVMDDFGLIGALFEKTQINKTAALQTKDQKLRPKKIKTKAQVLQDLGVKITTEAVRATRQAFRAGLKVGEDLVKVKKEIKKALKVALKDTSVSDKQKAQLVERISNAPTLEALKKVTAKVEARAAVLVEKARRKTLVGAIKKFIKKNKSKMGEKGKMTPEISELIDELPAILGLSAEEAATQLAESRANPDQVPNSVEKVRRMALAIATGDLALVDVKQIESLLISLYDLASEGKNINENDVFARARKEADLRNELQELIDPVISEEEKVDADGETVLDENGDPLMIKITRGQDAPGVKKQLFGVEVAILGQSGAWWNRLLRVMRSSDAKRVEALVDSLSLFDEARAAEAGRRKMTNRLEELMTTATGVPAKELLKYMQSLSSNLITVGEFDHSSNRRKTIRMTAAELIQLVAELNQPDVYAASLDPEGDAYTVEIIDAMRNRVYELDHGSEIIQSLTEFYNEYYSRINETYKKAEFVNLPREELYIPTRRIGPNEPQEFLTALISRGGPSSASLKARTGSRNKLSRRNFYAAAGAHIAEMEYYIAYQDKVRLLLSVVNAQTLGLIEEIYGKDAKALLQNDLDYFSRKGINTAMAGEKLFINLMRNFSVAALAIRPIITIKQLLSFPAFAQDVSTADFMLGIAHLIARPKQAFKAMRKSEFYQTRGNRTASLDLADINADQFGSKILNVLGRNPNFTDALMLNIKIGDKGAILLGGYAHYWAKRKKLIKGGMPAKEAEAKAFRSFEKIAVRTQQSYDPDQQSQQQRSSSFGRILAQFKSSANALSRAEYAVILERARGRSTNAEFAKGIVIFHFIIPNLIQLASNLGDWDEDDQKRASFYGSLNGLFIFGDLLEYIAGEIIGDDDPFKISVRHPYEMFSDLITAIADIDEYGWTDILDATDELERAVKALQDITGIPVQKLYNIMRGGSKTLDGELDEGVPLLLGASPHSVEQRLNR